MRKGWLVLLVALFPAALQSQSGWVTQNNAQQYITRNANSAYAVTITQQNTSACTLKLVSGTTAALAVCGTTVTFATDYTLSGIGTLTFSGGQSLVGTTTNKISFGLTPWLTFNGFNMFYAATGGGGGGVAENLFIGYKAGNAWSASNTSYANVVIGPLAAPLLNGTGGTDANSNVIVGYGSASVMTTGNRNTIVGTGAGASATTVTGLTYIGYHAGIGNTGANNTVLGNLAFVGTGAGENNVAIGVQALAAVTSGGLNVGIGYQAGNTITTGSNNYILAGNGETTPTPSTSNYVNLFGVLTGNYSTKAVTFPGGLITVGTAANAIQDNAGLLRFSGGFESVAGNNAMTGSLTLNSRFEFTAGGSTGLLLLRNAAETKGVMFDVETADNVLSVISRAGADTATVKANKLQITGLPAFVASDKYVVVDSSGNFHVSALGPASEPSAAFAAQMILPSLSAKGYIVLTADEYADFQAMRAQWKQGVRH